MQTQIIEAPSLKTPKAAKTSRRTSKPASVRLAAHVDTSGGFFACHPCDLSVMQANGYPQISAPSPITGEPSKRNAHTVAWEAANGMPVPEGKIVLHAKGCSKTCCNPLHLRLGSHAENAQDKVEEGRASRRLTKAEVLEIVMLHQRDGLPPPPPPPRFRRPPPAPRRILRGQTHSKLTGIERNRKIGGGPRKSASAVPAPAPMPPDIIILDKHRKAKATKPDATVLAVAH